MRVEWVGGFRLRVKLEALLGIHMAKSDLDLWFWESDPSRKMFRGSELKAWGNG